MLSGTELYDQLLRYLFVAAGARVRRVPYRFAEHVQVIDLPGKGSLPPVVLLHGFSASGPQQYATLSRLLHPHVRRILLPDLPGHGASSLPASGLDAEAMIEGLTAAMDALLDERPVMFASSMAGGVSVRYALDRPRALAGLILCSPSGAPFTHDQIEPFFRVFRLHSHRDALDFVDRLHPYPWPMRHAYAWGVRQQFNRPHLVRLIEQVPRTRFLEPRHLAALSVPVHLIWGRRDDLLPAAHFDFYRQHLPPGSTIDAPAHFGHTPFLHHPRELADRMLAFLRRVASTHSVAEAG